MNAVLTMDSMSMTFLMMFCGWILSTLMEKGDKERDRERERKRERVLRSERD